MSRSTATLKTSSLNRGPMHSKLKWAYAGKQLDAAQRLLMLPHPKGEADSIARSFHECELGLQDAARNGLDSEFDDDARAWVNAIRSAMDTTGAEAKSGEGNWFAKASTLTVDEKAAYASAVADFAYWLDSRFRGE